MQQATAGRVINIEPRAHSMKGNMRPLKGTSDYIGMIVARIDRSG
jgi:hypothetical protein